MVPSGPCISICIILPGLASHWHTGLLNPFGPHHCATCLGSVHASQTSSIGALIRRVSVIWRVAVLFFVSIFFVQNFLYCSTQSATSFRLPNFASQNLCLPCCCIIINPHSLKIFICFD